MNRFDYDAAIVGGGIFGLTAAYRLAVLGYRVALFERDRTAGGLCGVFRYGETYVEEYHHFFSGLDDALMGLCGELGIPEAIGWRGAKTANWADGTLYPFYRATDLLRFPKLPVIDRLRFGLAFAALRRISDWRRLEGVSVRDFVTRWAGERSYEVVWKPLMESKFAGHADDIPASWLWARSRRRLGSGRVKGGGHLFGYCRGSVRVLLDRLWEECSRRGAVLHAGEEVLGVSVADGAVSGVRTSHGAYTCRSLLFTGALPQLMRLGIELDEGLLKGMRQIEYQAILNVALLTGRSLSDYFWINVLSRDVAFPGVIEMTKLRDPAELGGAHLIYLPRYLPKEHELYRAPDEEVAALFMRDLARMLPAFDPRDVLACRVFRSEYADPFYTLHYSRKIPPHQTGVGGLFLGNTAQIYPETRSANNSIRFGTKLAHLMGVWLGQPSLPHR